MERVAFVGLTDFYAESICLFHQMFGGPVSYSAEFENDRWVSTNVGTNFLTTLVYIRTL